MHDGCCIKWFGQATISARIKGIFSGNGARLPRYVFICRKEGDLTEARSVISISFLYYSSLCVWIFLFFSLYLLLLHSRTFQLSFLIPHLPPPTCHIYILWRCFFFFFVSCPAQVKCNIVIFHKNRDTLASPLYT